MSFNYIVTIHNSEPHLKKVMEALFKVKGKDSEVYCILDGCSDKSEWIVDEFDCKKVITPDVRETLTINAGLKVAPQLPGRYNIILQDDVVMLDPDTEKKIISLYQKFPDLGVVSFRHGGNFEQDALTNGKPVSETDLIQNIWQPPAGLPLMPDGKITFRQIVYKSPICLSSDLVQRLGGYDERFAPIAHDDTEYCIRAHQLGLKNAVVSLKVDQPIEWGGSKRFPKKFTSMSSIMHKLHMDLLRELYPEEIKSLSNNHPPLDQMDAW